MSKVPAAPPPSRSRRPLLWIGTVLALLVLAASTFWLVSRQRQVTGEPEDNAPIQKAEPPPDLARSRSVFLAGVGAVSKGDGAGAVRQLSSFTFGSRAVEEYRLFYLAKAHALAGGRDESRRVYAMLWERSPRMVHSLEAAQALGDLYFDRGSWSLASRIYPAVASRESDEARAAAAGALRIESSFFAGDVGEVIRAARSSTVEQPGEKWEQNPARLLRDLTGIGPEDPRSLTPPERVSRAERLTSRGEATRALAELAMLNPSALASPVREQILLMRGIASHRAGRFEESNRLLEPLGSSVYRFAVPALHYASRNYHALARSINPVTYKTIVEKQRVAPRKGPAVRKSKSSTAAGKAAAKKPVAKKSATKKPPQKKPPVKKKAPKKAPAAKRPVKKKQTSLEPFSNPHWSSDPAPVQIASLGPLDIGGSIQWAASGTRSGKKPAAKRPAKRAATTSRRKGKPRSTQSRQQFRTVTRTVKLIDLPLQYKKENYEKLYLERLKDLLLLPVSNEIRRQTLTLLIARAVEKNQDDYLKTLVGQLVKVEPATEAGLQRFWDRGWAAYTRGDFQTARESFLFLAQTYTNPNVRRQGEYWYARSLERTNEKRRAQEYYQKLVNSPFRDLYVHFSELRGAKRTAPAKQTLLDPDRPDWSEIAEREMPSDLRLAYELNALGLAREARLEVLKNANEKNRKYADAIISDLYYGEKAWDLAYRFARRAYPDLATAHQDGVPLYFLKMYHPVRHEEAIRKSAAKYKLDPYLVMGLIRQESAFNVNAKSVVGAMGLMQIMPATGRELGRKVYGKMSDGKIREPEVNIELGTYYLKYLIDKFDGNVELALASYNGGFGNVGKWRNANRGKPADEFIEGMPFGETRNYVKRITLLRGAYAELHGK